jgi:GNAT superfamily N-acetyltransferase
MGARRSPPRFCRPDPCKPANDGRAAPTDYNRRASARLRTGSRINHLEDVMQLLVSPLAAEDHEMWEVLARGYKTFYETEASAAEYETCWRRLLGEDGIFGLGARMDGSLVGIAHYLFHTSVWAPTFCYLQDLFVAPEARGRGVGRALIETVAAVARDADAARYYWLTQEHNAAARVLYDKVARYNGFIRYEFPLERGIPDEETCRS